MEGSVTPIPAKFIKTDLAKPLFGAAWTGLVLSLFDGWPKRSKITALAILVVIGTVWLTVERNRPDGGEA